MKFVFIGDVHGNVPHCVSVCKANRDASVIQIGDFGVGFLHPKKFVNLPSNFWFFCGNHDCRKDARHIDNALADFGEFNESFFYVSGADSIDKDMRIEGVSWWPDEELSYQQASNCLFLWEHSKVKVLVSHDCPQSFAEKYKLIYNRSLTRDLLQKMIETRPPELIITGHHHVSKDIYVDGIRWKELSENEVFTIDL